VELPKRNSEIDLIGCCGGTKGNLEDLGNVLEDSELSGNGNENLKPRGLIFLSQLDESISIVRRKRKYHI